MVFFIFILFRGAFFTLSLVDVGTENVSDVVAVWCVVSVANKFTPEWLWARGAFFVCTFGDPMEFSAGIIIGSGLMEEARRHVLRMQFIAEEQKAKKLVWICIGDGDVRLHSWRRRGTTKLFRSLVWVCVGALHLFQQIFARSRRHTKSSVECHTVTPSLNHDKTMYYIFINHFSLHNL